MKIKFLASALLVASTFSASAAVSVIHEYRLGEAGSLSGSQNLPVDSVGSADFTADNQNQGSSALVSSTGVSAPGSTHYVDTRNMNGSGSSNGGWFGPDYSSIATDNFAFGIYARADSLGQGIILSMGGTQGAYDLSLSTNGWAASANGQSWIGGNNGVVDSFTAGEWVHLALVRKSGSTSFFINGVAQGSAYATAPVHGGAHLVVNPGGSGRFSGDIDEARIVTFDAADSNAAIFSALQAVAVPEPSSAALLGLGGLALILRRRK